MLTPYSSLFPFSSLSCLFYSLDRTTVTPTSKMLALEPVTEADLPAITDLWYSAFGPSGFLELIPDTPNNRDWWNSANGHDLHHKPTAYYWKVVDTAQPSKPLIAYAKWDLESAEERGDRFPPWHADMNKKGCDDLFGKLEKQRSLLLGGTKNYCMPPNALEVELDGCLLSRFGYALHAP